MASLDTQSTPGWTIHHPTPVNTVNIVDPAPAPNKVNTVTTPHVQQLVMPVSFVSTTQVQMDAPVPPTVDTVIPQVSMTRIPLLQIPSMDSTANTMPSSQPQDENADACRKCGKNTHTMVKCHKRVTCKKCKCKDHNTRFCTRAPAPESKLPFVGKESTLLRTAGQEREANSGGLSVTVTAM